VLESDARQKLCFVAIGREYLGRPGTVFCVGSGCMAWQAAIKRGPGTRETKIDPPEGECGMIPPELYCEGR
jgi:hypothetical protein